MRVAVYGAGAMGTILGAYIAKSGRPVDLVSRNKEHISALKEHGAHIVGAVDFIQPVCALLPEEMTGKYDLIFLMTKQSGNRETAAFLSSFLVEEGVICTMQNGLPEPVIAEEIGEDRIYGCAVAWGATWESPGVSRLTSDAEALTFSLGAFGQKKDFLPVIASFLSVMGKVFIVEDLLGARWTKLSINAAFSGISAVTAMSFGEIATEKKSRKIALAILRECARVAKASGIRPAKIQGKNALRLLGGESLLLRTAAYVLLPWAMKKHAALHSGMLMALRAGKKCEIDYIDGVISDYGKKYGVPTPYCDAVCAVAHEIEQGKRTIGTDNLIALAEIKNGKNGDKNPEI